MSTTTRTYRLAKNICDLLAQEAEKRRTSEAEIVRRCISQYFESAQTETALLSLEQRLTARLDAHTQHLSTGLQQILSLAEPI